MTVVIEKSRALGGVFAPPSKSAAHRALICSALTERSIVNNISYSSDISATLDCLSALGANVERNKSSVSIGGLDPFSSGDCILNCNESGSTLRFLIPLCMLGKSKITLRGSERLFLRNLDAYEDIASASSLLFAKRKTSLTVQGPLKNGEFTVPGDISSQFISGLLFALPLLNGDSTIKISRSIESAPYINLTLNALKAFGISIDRQSENLYKISGNQRYKAQTINVEGDCSNAAFLDAFNLLGGDVEVKGLDNSQNQGDSIYKKMFSDLQNGVKSFDLTDCPDLAPVMFALSAYYGGAEFFGTRRLKIKESDRANAMKQELVKFGIPVTVSENSVKVEKAPLKAPSSPLCSHNDHRIVMSLALLCSVTGGEITGAEAVRKSYPDFFEKIKSLGIVVKTNEA